MPKEQPRDHLGTLPHDHDEILDDFHVIRHIVPPNDLSADGQGGFRVSSGAFSESSDPHGGMSVDIEEWMVATGLPPLHYVRSDAHGAVRIRVGDLRALNLKVGWDPRKEEPPYPANPHHGLVWGLTQSKRKRVRALATTIRKAQGES